MTETVRTRLLLGLLFVYAVITRILAVTQPYHQDEYKWAIEVNPATGLTNPVHPPFADYAYRFAGLAFGFSRLRIVPIVLSLATLTLLFVFARRWWGTRIALAISAVYAFSFYGLLASTQIDIDGAFLPLAALLAFGAYTEALHASTTRTRRRWLYVLAAVLLIGFTIKLSFVLVPATLALVYAFREPRIVRDMLSRRDVLVSLVVVAIAGGVTLVFLWTRVPFLAYVDRFVGFGGRNFGELAFLTVKGALYLSPLILFGIAYGLRVRRELAVWYVFLALNVVFYFVVFDFTHTTFDRYLMFLILPGSVITGYVLAASCRGIRLTSLTVALSALVALLASGIFLLPHMVLPLIPKSSFVHAALSGHWGFLIPFTGGSGPVGFYMPADGLALLWGTAALGALLVVFTRARRLGFALVLATGLVYNVAFTQEYLGGTYFGSVPRVTHALTAIVAASSTIPAVITYEDTGAYELLSSGKYVGRFYPHSEFIAANQEKFASSTGYYLVVDFPWLDPVSGYGRFFSRCVQLATAQDARIVGHLYDCRNVSPAVLTQE